MNPTPTDTRLTRILRPNGPAAIGVVRVVVGLVFIAEGIQKFLFPAELGVGRFVKIGIPMPELMAPFVGALETLGGALLVVGLFSRMIAVPLLISMIVAITSTKLAIFGKVGFWKTAHEARTDALMIAGLVTILALGPGRASIDARVANPRR
jgi:putative oxidoreductase